MNAPYRRGACPGLSTPMPTGDGLLVRLMPTEPVRLDAFAEFCEAASRHGNGTVEISARGSMQVRGLTSRSAPLFAAALAELDIAADDGVPIMTGPLDAVIDTAAVELRRALSRARLALSPKVSVVIDGNGGLHLDAVSADIRLRMSGPAEPPRFHVGLGRDGASATWLGSIAPAEAAYVVLSLLSLIAAHGPTARAADILRAEGIEVFRSVSEAHVEPAAPPPQRAPAEMIGLHPVGDGTFAVGIGLPFGHAHADALAEIARVAAAHGTCSARTAPARALLLISVAAPDATGLQAAAEQLGFVTRADDPRRRIVACPGAPACASGLIPARALAVTLAPTITAHPSPGRGVSVHISGCPKGCAHPGPAALTLVGTEQGCGIVRDGSARATPDSHVDPANLANAISQIAADTCEAAHG
jgi:precorrin-3B synthase